MKTAVMSGILQWLEQFNELIKILEEEYQLLLTENDEEAANRSLAKEIWTGPIHEEEEKRLHKP